MQMNRVVVGYLGVNCYLLEKDNQILIVDPGDDFDTIYKEVKDRKVLGILVTHKHFDHIGALEKCLETYKVSLYKKDTLQEQAYKIGPFAFVAIFTPGHSEDSVTYYFKEEGMMFVGDFIFEGTIGRCDLWDGNYHTMMESIEKIKQYPNIKLYPGHGNSTTLDKEKIANPYFKERLSGV